jgi:hypothetical protein
MSFIINYDLFMFVLYSKDFRLKFTIEAVWHRVKFSLLLSFVVTLKQIIHKFIVIESILFFS